MCAINYLLFIYGYLLLFVLFLVLKGFCSFCFVLFGFVLFWVCFFNQFDCFYCFLFFFCFVFIWEGCIGFVLVFFFCFLSTIIVWETLEPYVLVNNFFSFFFVITKIFLFYFRTNRWWTSGQNQNGEITWSGDGPYLVATAGSWVDGNDVTGNNPDLAIVFEYDVIASTFRWGQADVKSKLPFVCEVTLREAFRIVQRQRDFSKLNVS